MAEYVNITADEMEAFLGPKGFKPLPLDGCQKHVWAKRVDRDGMSLSLRVYSGINFDGNSRGVGQDAIRVAVFWRDETDGSIHMVIGDKRVHRVKGWRENLQKRLDRWSEGLGPSCPQCSAPMKLREPKGGAQWAPFYGCLRWKPGKKGCEGVVRSQNKTKPRRKPQPRRKSPSPALQGKGEAPWEVEDRLSRAAG